MIPVIDTPAKHHHEYSAAHVSDEKMTPAAGMVSEISNVVFNLAASINRVYVVALNQAERKSR
jgi:hypothetical protein